MKQVILNSECCPAAVQEFARYQYEENAAVDKSADDRDCYMENRRILSVGEYIRSRRKRKE